MSIGPPTKRFTMTVIPAKSYLASGYARPRLPGDVSVADSVASELLEDASARQMFLECPQAFLGSKGVDVPEVAVASTNPPGREGLGVNYAVAINAVAYFNVAVDVVAVYAMFFACNWGFIGCWASNEPEWRGLGRPWDGSPAYVV